MDITLVSVLVFQVYKLVKGSLAVNIVVGLLALYGVYWLVDLMHLKLLSVILDQFIKLGVLLLIIIFQPEIRRFLLVLGRDFIARQNQLVRSVFLKGIDVKSKELQYLQEVILACRHLSKNMSGALIVFEREADLDLYVKTGTLLNSRVSARLLETIFQKMSPLHDGAVIIHGDKILAASCILPVSENPSIQSSFGLRHRSALGLTEHSDALVLVISEETGLISIASHARINHPIDIESLSEKLTRELDK